MSKSSKGALTQLDIVQQIIEKGCVVEVGGYEVRLTPPARSTIAHLHQTPKDKDKLTPEEDEMFSFHNTAVESVKACIPGLGLDAEGLLALSGGDFGDLAGKAMQLCGLQVVHDFARSKVDEALNATDEQPASGGEVDPTSS